MSLRKVRSLTLAKNITNINICKYLVDFFNKQLAENREITDAVWENLKKSWIAHGLKERQDEFTEKINTT